MDRERSEAPAGPARVLEQLGVDAGAAEPVDPPARAGDLRGELDAFTTVDACVSEHAALDPLVGDAIRAIGYDTLLRDACRMLDAAKRDEPKACDAIDASALRSRCRAVTAMVAGKVDECPWSIPDDTAYGREPTCVAVALRDPRLCIAEARSGRATCEAIATRDEARCRDEGARSCKRDAARWRRIVEPQTGLAPLPKVEGRLAVHGAAGTADPPRPESDVGVAVARGVVVRSGAVTRFDVGTARESGLGSTSSPLYGTRLGATIAIDAKGAQIEHLEIDVPGASTLVHPGVRCDCKVTVGTFDKKRGGAIALRIEGEIGVPPRAYAIRADLATFVRDITDEPSPRLPRK